MKNIVENNKLIAEFMGLNLHQGVWRKSTLATERKICKEDALKYHSDWNWLKLVLEKISYLNKDNFSDETKQALEDLLSLSLFSTKENIYKSIINFIKTIK